MYDISTHWWDINNLKHNCIVSALASFLFFSAWWLAIDLSTWRSVEFHDIPQTVQTYYNVPAIVATVGMVFVNTIPGAGALKDVAVTVPLAVKSMDTVTLQCKYNLEGEPLYTVKWYKGQQEFYRYIPKELPNTQVFPLPGINVDLSKSTPNEVVLRHVQPEVTGRYKCEVSTDAPNFYTQIMSGYMYVVDIPEDDPKMEVEKEVLEYGYLVRGNCISPSSFPPANVSWYLNGIKMNESHLKRVSVDSHYVMAAKNRRTPVKTVSYLDIEIDDNMFQGGVARLQCVATLFNLYRGDDSRFIEDDRPKPRPSSVLGTPDKSSARSLAAEDCFIVLLLSALLLR